MRKKTISYLIDSLFWVLISVLPFVFYGIYLIHGSEGSVMTFTDFFSNNVLGLMPLSTNIIKDSLLAVFGSNGVLPFFADNNVIFDFCAYFVIMNIIHLFLDFVLWIPRLCHKIMDKFVKES